ncbi:MAG: hypothetical protein IKC09_01990 [Oscillospiraceae bacterium]|nr:hypothetical protein [Oscillospiraceae bacterium]
MVWFGHTGYTITALTIELSRDRETGDTVELTYEIPEGDALRSVPEMDSGIDVLSSVALSKAVITPGVAGVASVKLTYTKPKVEEEEEDSEGGENGSEEGEGSGEDGEGEEGSSPARTVSFTTSFDVTVVDQPILTHPKMASISGGQLEYLKAFMDGARLWELVPEVDNAGKPKLDSDGLPVMKQLGKLLNTGSKAFDLINKGVTAYKDIMATYTVRQTSRTDKSDISSVGTINDPPKAPKFPNRSWLQVSSNCSMNDDGKTYTIENTWLLSGLGGWDKDLYGA